MSERDSALLKRELEISECKSALEGVLSDLKNEREERQRFIAETAKIQLTHTEASLAFQTQITALNEVITSKNNETKQLQLRLQAADDISIPTELDSIREVTMKCARLSKELEEAQSKNKQLHAQLEFLSRDVKAKLP